jgi:hypothetical protein
MQQTVSFRPRSTKRVKLTDFKGNPYRVYYTDGNGTMQEIPLGASNTVLTSAGPGVPPTFEPTGVAGALVGTATTGDGVAVAGNVVSGVARFRSISGVDGVSVSDTGDKLLIGVAASLLPAFTGATAVANGAKGAVPAPLVADQLKFLRGDGVWAAVTAVPITTVGAGASPIYQYAPSTTGLQLRTFVAGSNRVTVSQNAQDISIDVTTANLAVFGGATASVAGTKGIVPQPSPGDNTKFLRGDGAWVAPAVTTMANVGAGAGVYKNYTTQQNLRSLRSLNTNLVILVAGDEVTFDLSSLVVTAPMVGATAVSDGVAGIVPKPVAGENNQFLRGDGQWASPTIAAAATNVGSGIDVYQGLSVTNELQFRRIRSLSAALAVTLSTESVTLTFNEAGLAAFTGATALLDGAKGVVPFPEAGDQGKFLRGDGTWAALTVSIASGEGDVGDVSTYRGIVDDVYTMRQLRGIAPVVLGTPSLDVISISVNPMIGASAVSAGVAGVVAAPPIGSQDKFLKGDGTWDTVAVMTPATSTTPGTAGLVPAPGAGADTRFLRGDGAWVDLTGIGEANTASNAGAGFGVFRSKNGVDLSFKSLVAGTAISIVSGADTLTLGVNANALPLMTGATAIMAGERGSVPPPAAGDNAKVLYGDGVWRTPPGASGGEANTASNQGVGVPVFIQKTGIDLEFRSFRSAHAAITVTGDPDEVFVGLNPAGLPAMTGAAELAPGAAGVVPAPAAGDHIKFLRGDGTWQTVVMSVPVYVGATVGAPGVTGTVPAAPAGDHTKFLRGDGTWQNVPNTGVWGAISGTLSNQTDLQNALNGKASASHTHATMTGAGESTAGAAGIVPAPAAGEHNAVLHGDGTWREVTGGGGSTPGGSITAPLSILAMGIAAARDNAAMSPLLTPDGFVDGCQDLDNAVTAQTTYGASSNGYLTNAELSATNIAVPATATAIASHEYGGGYTADMAIDGNSATRWAGANVAATPMWFGLDFGVTPRAIGRLVVYRSVYDPIWTPVVAHSDNGTDWTEIYTHSTLPGTVGDNNAVTLDLPASGSHRYWRVAGDTTGTALSFNTVEAFEVVSTATPVYVSNTRVLGYEPTTASVVIVAALGGQALNTVFQAFVSNNNGVNWDQVTLSDNGVAPYAAGARSYVGTLALPMRATSSMKLKIVGGSAVHYVYGIGLLCAIPVVAAISEVVVASSLDDLLESIRSGYAANTGTQQHIAGTVVLPKDLTGLHGSSTFQIVNGRFRSNFTSPPSATDSALNAAVTSSSGTPSAANDGNNGSYWQCNPAVGWIRFDLVTPQVIAKLLMRGYYDANNALKDFTLSGSNNDADWTLLYSGTMQSLHDTDQIFEFTPASMTPYRYFRIDTVNIYTGYAATLFTVSMYAITSVSVTDPFVMTATQTLAVQPKAANVVVVATLAGTIPGTSFFAEISTNAGVNWEQVTLTDYGALLPGGVDHVLGGSLNLVDRGTKDVRLRVKAIGTASVEVLGAAVGYGDKISIGSVAGGGATAWGSILGAIADQTDLQAALNAKAATSHGHAAMTGAGVSTAGTAGMVPAPAAGDQAKFLRGDGTWAEGGGGGGGGSGTSSAITGLSGLTPQRAYGFDGTNWVLSVADAPPNADVIGVAVNATTLVIGGVAVILGAAFTPGADYWLSPTTPGLLVTPEPAWTYGQVRVYVGTALSATELSLAIDIGDVILNAGESVATKTFVRATKSVNQYYAAGGAWAIVNYDTVVSGASQVVTGTNWAFTAARDGRYMVTAATGLEANVTAQIIIAIYVNGVPYSQRALPGVTGAVSWGNVGITDLVELHVNDVVDIRIYSGLTTNIWGAQSTLSIVEL